MHRPANPPQPKRTHAASVSFRVSRESNISEKEFIHSVYRLGKYSMCDSTSVAKANRVFANMSLPSRSPMKVGVTDKIQREYYMSALKDGDVFSVGHRRCTEPMLPSAQQHPTTSEAETPFALYQMIDRLAARKSYLMTGSSSKAQATMRAPVMCQRLAFWNYKGPASEEHFVFPLERPAFVDLMSLCNLQVLRRTLRIWNCDGISDVSGCVRIYGCSLYRLKKWHLLNFGAPSISGKLIHRLRVQALVFTSSVALCVYMVITIIYLYIIMPWQQCYKYPA